MATQWTEKDQLESTRADTRIALPRFAFLHGRVVPYAEARVGLLTHALHYGSGVFEGARMYHTPKGSAILRLDAHIARLLASARVNRMDVPYTQQQLEQAVVSARVEAYHDGRSFEPDDLSHALASIVPLSRTMEEQMKRIRSWAFGRATVATSPDRS